MTRPGIGPSSRTTVARSRDLGSPGVGRAQADATAVRTRQAVARTLGLDEVMGAEFTSDFPGSAHLDRLDPRRYDGPVSHTPVSVLVVDDEEDVRDLLQAQLERLGHSVVAVPDGPSALAVTLDRDFTLILLDYTMPGGLTGADTIRELRRRGCKSKMVVITSRMDDPAFDEIMADDLAVDGYVNKPFDLRQVERCLEVVLDRGGRFLSSH